MSFRSILTAVFAALSVMGGIYIARPQNIRPHPKEVHLRNIRQLTFGGENAEAVGVRVEGAPVQVAPGVGRYREDTIMALIQGGRLAVLLGKAVLVCIRAALRKAPGAS